VLGMLGEAVGHVADAPGGVGHDVDVVGGVGQPLDGLGPAVDPGLVGIVLEQLLVVGGGGEDEVGGDLLDLLERVLAPLGALGVLAAALGVVLLDHGRAA